MYDVYIALFNVEIFERPLDSVKPKTVRLEMTGPAGGREEEERVQVDREKRWALHDGKPSKTHKSELGAAGATHNLIWIRRSFTVRVEGGDADAQRRPRPVVFVENKWKINIV